MDHLADDGLIELSLAIAALRQQLITAQKEGAGQPLSFRVGKVEVEFGAEIKSLGGGRLGLKLGVISFDGKTERSIGATHKVKVELIPEDSTGRDWHVAGKVDELPVE